MLAWLTVLAREEVEEMARLCAEAIRAAAPLLSPDAQSVAGDVLAQIETEWPPGPALKTLGTDAALWQQWYDTAREVL